MARDEPCLSWDVLRLMVSRMSLWDARRLQKAHPTCAQVVSDVVEDAVRRSTAQPIPDFLDKFMSCTHDVNRRYGAFALKRTGTFATVVYDDGEVRVRMFMYAHLAKMWLEVAPQRPGFGALETALTTLLWLRGSYKTHMPHKKLVIATRADKHCPTSEVLNGVAEKFVETHCPSDPWF